MVQQRTMPVFMEQRAQNTDSLDILYVISWYFKVILILVFSLAEYKDLNTAIKNSFNSPDIEQILLLLAQI